jgi:hypothetical protein
MTMNYPQTGGDVRPVPDPTTLTTAQLLRELGALRELLFTRLDAMDKATTVLAETVNRTPTAIQTAVANLRDVYDERFKSVEQQFLERDVRTEQAATASASALAAALQAAKEAVFEQAQAAARAAEKTELSFTKQIDQIGLQITTVAESVSDRIGELKERIDRNEGQNLGTAVTETSTRLNVGTIISIVAVVLVLVGVIVNVIINK